MYTKHHSSGNKLGRQQVTSPGRNAGNTLHGCKDDLLWVLLLLLVLLVLLWLASSELVHCHHLLLQSVNQM